ncbi:MAG: molybdopterin-synthase adenylyltransferase MoeB [Pseudomonadota bacterium]
MSLSSDELERYARHIVLHEIGGPGQQRLKAAHAVVVGAGGLGCPALLYLAAAGVGQITIIDDDMVSLSNLQRQVLYATSEVGRPKAEAAAEALSRINPEISVRAVVDRLQAENAARLLEGANLVLDGSDNAATRYTVNAAAIEAGIPLVAAAIGRWEGQVGVFDPARGGPCYVCAFPEAPDPDLVPACAEAGVLGALAGVIGAMQAVEAVKLIAGAGEALTGRLMLYDALSAETRVLRLRPRAGCRACGGGKAARRRPERYSVRALSGSARSTQTRR